MQYFNCRQKFSTNTFFVKITCFQSQIFLKEKDIRRGFNHFSSPRRQQLGSLHEILTGEALKAVELLVFRQYLFHALRSALKYILHLVSGISERITTACEGSARYVTEERPLRHRRSATSFCFISSTHEYKMPKFFT